MKLTVPEPGTASATAANSGTAHPPRRFWASNPHARHTRVQLAELRPRMQALDIAPLAGEDAADWVRVLAAAALGPEDLLVVHGGDGTLQVILTALGRVLPVVRWPTLALLPAGGTNMTAYDGGGRQSFAEALDGLEAMLRGQRPRLERRRPVLRVADGDDVHYGFFFGAGAIVRGIEFYHREIARGAVGDEFASGLTLLRGAWGIARRDRRFIDASHAVFEVEGQHVDQDLLMFFATTLDRLFMGIRPYWGGGTGGMHTTWIRADVRHFFWRLPRLLRRGGGLTPEQGYNSRDIDALTLRLNGPYTLDGELFPAPASALTLQAEGPVRILRCVGGA